MIVENQVWACTAMLNRPLVELVGAVPDATMALVSHTERVLPNCVERQ